MTKAWNVMVGMELAVVAETESEAEEIALQNMRNEEPTTVEANPLSYMPSRWNGNCVPYGAVADDKIGPMLERATAQRRREEYDRRHQLRLNLVPA